ncbi:outer membrane protein assembly factor BamB family protein [Solirubrobacter soli]|uniref:outer membrane protein assembly factor BamB family protein n=1 Tax=Solirubrobacter soli TaxID=363832 RepID=UPI0004202AE4|nr:PQQ-binding-like beta-propeller repeat protein [Solirubrobacter soli]
MRLFSVALAVVGVVVGVVLPAAGLGLIPLLVGAACLAAAGVIARRGRLIAAAGIAAALALLLAPLVVDHIRNRQGIAWAVPEGEGIVLAEAGYAVTRDDGGHVLTGRDLATGKQRWRVRLAETPNESSQFGVQRVGGVLIVHDRGGRLSGVDLATGKQRWRDPRGDSGIPAVASSDVFALERCDDGDCVVEAHAVPDGTLRWRADAARSSEPWLGAPRTQAGTTGALWPASIVVLRSGKRGEHYEVRALEDGRVLERGEDATAVTGSTVVHSEFGGDLWATDAFTGRELWRRDGDGDHAVRSAEGLLTTVGLPDGSVLLTRTVYRLPLLVSGDRLRTVDPRTGKLTETPRRLQGAVDVVDPPPAAVTAETARDGVPARTPVVVKTVDGDALQADGRVYDTGDLEVFSAAATAAQVGWESDQPAFGRGDRDGAEVHDRRTGKRLVRFTGEHVDIRSVGERLVISTGDEDHRRDYVVGT